LVFISSRRAVVVSDLGILMMVLIYIGIVEGWLSDIVDLTLVINMRTGFAATLDAKALAAKAAELIVVDDAPATAGPASASSSSSVAAPMDPSASSPLAIGVPARVDVLAGADLGDAGRAVATSDAPIRVLRETMTNNQKCALLMLSNSMLRKLCICFTRTAEPIEREHGHAIIQLKTQMGSYAWYIRMATKDWGRTQRVCLI